MTKKSTIVTTLPLNGPQVVVLAYQELCTFEFAVAVEVFGLPRPEMGLGWYRFALASLEPSPLRATGGFTITVDGGEALLAQADILIIPGWRSPDAPVPAALCEQLIHAHQRGARLVALCSGAFVLAAAGLLNDRPATTHWQYSATLHAAYPDIQIAENVLYVTANNIYCSAGSSAALDLCLHLVANDYGFKAANMVARRLVLPPHRSGQAPQQLAAPVPRFSESTRLDNTLHWMRSNLDLPHTLKTLAARTHMGARTFRRRFSELTGQSPARWLLDARLSLAQRLLSDPASRLETVALACGFAGSRALRREFLRHLGTSPTEWKKLHCH